MCVLRKPLRSLRSKLKTSILSLSGHVDPFSLRNRDAGTCGAERLS